MHNNFQHYSWILLLWHSQSLVTTLCLSAPCLADIIIIIIISHLSLPCVSLLPVWLISDITYQYPTHPAQPTLSHLTALILQPNIMILILTRHTQSHTHITRPAQWHFAPSLLCSAVVIVIRHFISLHFSKYSESAAATFYCIAFIVLCVLLSRFMICKQSSFTT